MIALALTAGTMTPAAAATVRPASVATDPWSTYVSAVYQDLFGRGVDPVGLQAWTTALRSGAPRSSVANAITASDEYRQRLVTASYQRFLDRGPDASGLRHWVDQMHRGMTIQQMEAGFIASDEYWLRSGSTPSGWVRELYRHVLTRSASSTEVTGWVRALESGTSRAAVAMGFLLSTEHLTTVVDEHYRHLLDRTLDASGRTTWVRAIQTGTRVEQVIGAVVASDEYVAANSGTGSIPPTTASTSPPTGVPSASSTGVPAGTALRPSGSLTVSQPGTVIQGLHITGTVTVNADDVVIRNSKITSTGTIPVRNNGVNLVIENTEIDGNGKLGPAVAYNKYTLRKVNIHNIGEGPRIAGGNVVIEDSYIHHLVQVGDNHTDAIQIVSGKQNIVIRRNNVQVYNPDSGMFGNAALQFGEEDGIVRGCVVEGNLMNGGNLTVNGGGGGTTGAACAFSGNRFERNFRYGVKGNLGPNTTWDSSNVWHDSGRPV